MNLGRNKYCPGRHAGMLAIVLALLAIPCEVFAQPTPLLGLPPMHIPESNPITQEKIDLGKRLFFETGLSSDRSVSCASCHQPDRYFADDKPLSRGVHGYFGLRNAPTLLNAGFASHLMWDGRATVLEDQILYPLMHPREMANSPGRAIEYLSADPIYRALFKQAFGDETIIWDRVAKAIASFERTLMTGNSDFDRYMAGDSSALSRAAQRGFDLFKGTAGCISCHTYSKESPFFSDFEFHNTGLGWAASPDLGRYEISKQREDKGAFRTPSLRNVARTAPYMHDGRMATLQDVVEFYSQGGERNPFLDKRIRPLHLSVEDKSDLVAFLQSLTGDSGYRARRFTPANTIADPRQPGLQQRSPAEVPKVFAPFSGVEVVAGGRDPGDGGKAIDASFVGIGGVAVDAQGNVFLADSGGNRVRRIDAKTGVIGTIAGNGFLFGQGDHGPAIAAAVRGPAPIALDSVGRTLFVGEIIGHRVQQVDLVTGTINDLGAPRGGFGDPTGLSWSSHGLLVADSVRGQIWRLEANGLWIGLLPDTMRLRGGIRALVEDAQGRVYVSEYFAHRVLRWDSTTGTLGVAAGTGEAGRLADGAQAAKSPLRSPDGIAIDRDGNLLIADKGNHRIVRVDAVSGHLTTVIEAGGQGTDERWTPGSIAVDANGVLWIGDIHLNRLLRYALSGSAATVVAGRGDAGDGGPASSALLAHPGAVASDDDGNVYVSDTLHHRVREIERDSGRIRTVAGSGMPGYNGDGMPATEALLAYPGKLILDHERRLYIGDYYNNRVRRVDPRTGFITTIAGSGQPGEDGDGGLAEHAALLNPHALLLDDNSSLIIASAVSPKIRRVDLHTDRIDSLAMGMSVPETLVFYGLTHWNGGLALASPRPGSIEFLKDGKLSTLLRPPAVIFPQDVAVSPDGELYICETGRNRVLRWDGVRLEIVAENLGRPRSIAFDANGNLLIADTFHNRVLRLIAGSRSEH